MCVIAKGIPRGCQVNKVTHVSLGYPLSVFSKNSVLNKTNKSVSVGPKHPN